MVPKLNNFLVMSTSFDKLVEEIKERQKIIKDGEKVLSRKLSYWIVSECQKMRQLMNS